MRSRLFVVLASLGAEERRAADGLNTALESSWTRFVCPVSAGLGIGFFFVGRWEWKRLTTTNERKRKRPVVRRCRQHTLGLSWGCPLGTVATMMIRLHRISRLT